jgi:hypothetical protein
VKGSKIKAARQAKSYTPGMPAPLNACLACLAIVILAGCSGPTTGKIAGSWIMKEPPQTWEFKSDGKVLMDGSVGSIHVNQAGTYILNGNNLILNLSGKTVANSKIQKDQLTVSTINMTPPHPKQEIWDLSWQSPNEFTITLSTVVPSVTRTLDRKIN